MSHQVQPLAILNIIVRLMEGMSVDIIINVVRSSRARERHIMSGINVVLATMVYK